MHKEKYTHVTKEFSRFAYQYEKYNVIQNKVVATLISQLKKQKFENIIDIGCGSGAVYKQLIKQEISFDRLIASDASKEMLSLHPQKVNIFPCQANFNDKNFVQSFPNYSYSLVISSSALQWSEDIRYTLLELSKLSSQLEVAIFTSGTFKTLHRTAEISSPIYDIDTIKKMVLKHYDATFHLHHYKLEFDSVREMFKYIKQSGVSSGEKKLSYLEMKKLIKAYPLKYLEFEVLFVSGGSKNINAPKEH